MGKRKTHRNPNASNPASKKKGKSKEMVVGGRGGNGAQGKGRSKTRRDKPFVSISCLISFTGLSLFFFLFFSLFCGFAFSGEREGGRFFHLGTSLVRPIIHTAH